MINYRRITLLSLVLLGLGGCATAERKPQSREFTYHSPSSSRVLSEIEISEKEVLEYAPKAIRFMPKSCRTDSEQGRSVECSRASLE